MERVTVPLDFWLIAVDLFGFGNFLLNNNCGVVWFL